MKLYKRGKIWYAREGETKLSTGKTDYDEAIEVARKLMVPVALRSQASQMLETAKRLAKDSMDEADRLEGSRLSFARAFNGFPSERRDGLPKAKSTMENSAIDWRHFSRAMKALGKSCLGDVSEKEAREYLMSLPPRRRQVAYHTLRTVFVMNGVPNPFGKKPGRPSGDVQHREALTLEQIAKLRETVEEMTGPGRSTEEYRLFIRFLIYTGLRLGDAATVRLDEIDFTTGILTRKMGKTGFSVSFPLPQSILEALPREGEYVFPELARQSLAGQNSISHRIRKFFVEAGIKGRRQAYCAACLRTTFAEMCAERGVPISVIQSWLGHTSQEVTRIYARVESLAAKRRALAILPEI